MFEHSVPILVLPDCYKQMLVLFECFWQAVDFVVLILLAQLWNRDLIEKFLEN